MNGTCFGRPRWLLGGAAATLASLAYQGIQWGTETRAVLRESCWTWRQVPFAVAWIWPYVSLFLLLGLPWFLLPEWRQVVRFARALLGMTAVGWTVFLLHPTACVRPPLDGQAWAYLVLRGLDRANNCLPCLHSALAVLAAGVLLHRAPVFRRPLARVGLVLWAAVISFSAVALRQHTDIDTALGAVLGGVAAACWSRGELRPAGAIRTPLPVKEDLVGSAVGEPPPR